MAKHTKTPESDPARTQAEPLAPPPRPTASIAEGLLIAQRAIKSVGKGSTNTYHRYKYTSADDMIAACRDALHEGGLTVIKSSHSIAAPAHEIANAIDPDNPPMFLMVTSQFLLTHETGERQSFTFELPAFPEKGRPLDKAVLGCLTTSLGYFLRDLLQVPREDSNEIDQRDDTNYQPPQKQPNNLRRPPAASPAAPTPAQQQSMTPKQKLWHEIQVWTKIPVNESNDIASAGKRIYKHLNIPIDGKATDEDIAKARKYVTAQIAANVDFAEWAADPKQSDESAQAGPRVDKTDADPDPEQPTDEDIPY